MQKTWIILKSEFWRKLTSKTFIITTLLGPLLIIGFFVIIGVVAVNALSGDTRTIAVVDETGLLLERLQPDESGQHVLVAAEAPVDSVREAVLEGTYDGYLVIPQDLLTNNARPTYYAVEGGGFNLENWLENRIERAVQEHRMREQNVDPQALEILRTNVSVNNVRLTAEGEEAGSSEFYSILGFVMGMMIYAAMLIYGSVVMQGVIEEKTTRVVEVIISSVRPFYLLMGKVLGIGAAGLVQMVVWAAIMLAGITFAGTVVSMFLDPSALNLPATASQQELLGAANIALPSISIGVFVGFVLYFLLGYLLYAGLFAAVGSMVEQQQDAQGLMLPLMMPIILSIVFIQPIVESPHSTLAVVLSMIPFTSPVPMVVRLAVTEVPFWEVLLSFGLLVAGFLGAIWISSRIYRVGILMYGKKTSFKDVIRWFKYA